MALGNFGLRVAQDEPGLVLEIRVEESMDPALRERLDTDFIHLNKLGIDGSQSLRFGQIFGAADQDGVLTYLDERLGFIIPYEADLRPRLVFDEVDDGADPMIVATNVGTVLWMNAEAGSRRQLYFRFDKGAVRVDSSRVGIIMLGKGYSESLDPIERIGTHVHEARHSDCTGGLSFADLRRVRENELPRSLSCGHLHVACPPGHPYEGLFACDEHAWGSYAVQAIFYATVARGCAGCSERERQIALVAGADAASRVLVLDAMLDGDFGDPDMSSSGLQGAG